MNTFIITIASIGLINPISTFVNTNFNTSNENNLLEVITPNHTSIDSRKIKDYTSDYIMYIKNDKNERESIGFYTEQLHRVQLNEEQTLRIKKSETVAGKESLHMSMASATSLRPKYSISKSQNILKMVNFDGSQIQGDIVVDGQTTSFSEKTEVPYFDSNTSDLIVRALPLQSGYSATYWSYNVDKVNSLDYQTVSVVGDIKTKSSQSDDLVNAWLVKKVGSDSVATYTIEKSTHAILKIEVALQNGYTMVVERI